MKIDEYEFPEGLYYHKDHMWARKEDDLVIIGITDFTQKLAGTIKRIVTLEEDDEVSQDKPLGTMSSGKWTGKLYSPVSGEISEINEDVEDDPKICNEDPYGEGWIAKISPSKLDEELNKLMEIGQDFETWMKKEIEEKKALIDK